METIYKTYLSGMTCLSCEDLILERLYSLKGVIKVDVSYFRSFIEIKYDDSILSKEQINYQLSSIGYLADGCKMRLNASKKAKKQVNKEEVYDASNNTSLSNEEIEAFNKLRGVK